MLLRLSCWCCLPLGAAVVALTSLQAQDGAKQEDAPEIEPRVLLYEGMHYPSRVAIAPDNKTVISVCGAFTGVRF